MVWLLTAVVSGSTDSDWGQLLTPLSEATVNEDTWRAEVVGVARDSTRALTQLLLSGQQVMVISRSDHRPSLLEGISHGNTGGRYCIPLAGEG